MKRVLVWLMFMTLLWIARAPTVGAWGGGGDGAPGIQIINNTLRLDLSDYYFPFTIKVDDHTSSTPEPTLTLSPQTSWGSYNATLSPKRFPGNPFGGFLPPVIPKRYAFNTRARDDLDTSFKPGNRFTTNPRNPRLPPKFEDPMTALPNSGRDFSKIIQCVPGVTIWTENPPSDYVEPSWGTIAPRISLTYDVTGDGKTVIRPNWDQYYNGKFFQTDVDRLNTINPNDLKWGSFARDDGTFADESEFDLGGPILKDKLWFFGCWQCQTEKQATPLTYGKLSDDFSFALEYNYKGLLEAAAANPEINPFLAISNRVAEREKLVFSLDTILKF